MVIIYGNPLKKAYTYGREVGSIFCNRTEVWPKDVPVPDPYYIQWTPKLSTGTFSIGGVRYNFSDYPDGVFYLSDSVITEGAFYSNSSIQTIDTNAISISGAAFYSCYSLSQVNLPACKYLTNAVFRDCYSLSQVSMSLCEYIGSHAFYSCWALSQISLPVCSYIEYAAFYDCWALSQISLPVCTYISSRAFMDCYSLSQVYLGFNSVCRLNNSSTFYNTPIASGTGSIYVPSSLVSAYKSAENWSYYSSVIYPIQ